LWRLPVQSGFPIPRTLATKPASKPGNSTRLKSAGGAAWATRSWTGTDLPLDSRRSGHCPHQGFKWTGAGLTFSLGGVREGRSAKCWEDGAGHDHKGRRMHSHTATAPASTCGQVLPEDTMAKAGRLLMTAAILGTGPVFAWADLSHTHVFNPRWT